MSMAIVSSLLLGCSKGAQSADVKDQVEKALDQPAFKDVRVAEDREKGVVTLTGEVQTENDKQQAESLTMDVAGSQIVANEIGVRPSDSASEAKKVDSEHDAAIENNFKAALVSHKLDHGLKFKAKNGVLTLKGTVHSEEQRNQLQLLAAAIPDVQQVVNETEVKDRKATSNQ